MKYCFLTLTLLLVTLVSMAQTNPGNKMTEPSFYQESNNDALRQAGAALRKHTRQYYIGTGIVVGGLTLSTAAAVASINGAENGGLATVGSLATIAGMVIQIISHRHIGNAGKILERASMSSFQVQPSSTGVGMGLAYHF